MSTALYLQRRAEVLRHFLDRDRLYATGFFRDRLGAQARRNLARTIAGLYAEMT